MRHRAKFHQNLSNVCVDMALQRFLKIAVVRHLGFVFGPPSMSTCMVVINVMQNLVLP